MVDESISCDNHILRPYFDFYREQFLNRYGDLYRLQKSEIAAQIFDTFVLREVSIERIHALSNELVNFGYAGYFTPNIISSLKKEFLKDKY